MKNKKTISQILAVFLMLGCIFSAKAEEVKINPPTESMARTLEVMWSSAKILTNSSGGFIGLTAENLAFHSKVIWMCQLQSDNDCEIGKRDKDAPASFMWDPEEVIVKVNK